MYSATASTKELHQREAWLTWALSLSRTQRRQRGIKVERYRLEIELGFVQTAIAQIEPSTASSTNRVLSTATNQNGDLL